MDSLAARYAGALVSLAQEKDKVLEYKTKSLLIKDSLVNNSDFCRVLIDVNIDKKVRFAMLDKVFAELDARDIVTTLKVAIDNNRGNYLIRILTEFNHLCNEVLKISEGIVYSTQELTKKQMEEITKAISEKLNRQIDLKNRLNPSLLGGIKVIVDDIVFDGSILFKVEEMKSMLLKKGDLI